MPRGEFPGPSSQVSCRPHRPSRCLPSCSIDSDFSSIPSGSDSHDRPHGCGTSKYAGCVSDQGEGVTSDHYLKHLACTVGLAKIFEVSIFKLHS